MLATLHTTRFVLTTLYATLPTTIAALATWAAALHGHSNFHSTVHASFWEEFIPMVEEVVLRHLRSHGAEVVGWFGGTKSATSAMRKTLAKGVAMAALTDLVRGTVLVTSVAGVEATRPAGKELEAHLHSGPEVWWPEPPKPSVWLRGLGVLKLRLPGGLVGELQIMPVGLLSVKEKAHRLYEAERVGRPVDPSAKAALIAAMEAVCARVATSEDVAEARAIVQALKEAGHVLYERWYV